MLGVVGQQVAQQQRGALHVAAGFLEELEEPGVDGAEGHVEENLDRRVGGARGGSRVVHIGFTAR